MSGRLTSEQRRLLFVSNYGRWLGWEVLLDSEPICDLCFHSESEQFWDAYVIRPRDESHDVFNDDFWDSRAFVARSRAVPDVTVSDVIYRYASKDELLHARGLYAKDLRLAMWERLSLVFLG